MVVAVVVVVIKETTVAMILPTRLPLAATNLEIVTDEMTMQLHTTIVATT
jgi:hypothetical protein